ncbi:MAG: VWA domain-containing protein [Lapillicoccus sp.]
MELKQAWVILPAVVGLVLVASLVWWLMRRRRPTGTVAVANSDLLRGLPEYRRAVRAHQVRTLAIAALAAGIGLVAIVGAARPLQRSVISQERDNRDIVLCLDVSGSMIDVDAQVVSTFRRLVEGFRGERISLVIFNSTAVPVFPLTDDYDFITDQLATAENALQTLDPADPFFAGTLNGDGSSLIGDGLATCLRSFDHPELPRARSVILATDNEAAGRSLFTLPEAGQLATTGDIQIYGINPSDSPASSAAREMKQVVGQSGGVYYALNDLEAVSQILEAVGSREASRIPTTPQLVVHDQPQLWIGLAATGLGALLLLRRARWRP